MTDDLSTLHIKLGSAVVHAEEALSADGCEVDIFAFRSLLNDPEVIEWMEKARGLALLPVKRGS